VDLPENERLDWLIIGGESGPGARSFDVTWARQTIRECREAGVACFMKQMGARPVAHLSDERGWIADALSCWPEGTKLSQRVTGSCVHDIHLSDPKGGDMAEWPEDLRVREFPQGDGDGEQS
jgi:hypothetical protein